MVNFLLEASIVSDCFGPGVVSWYSQSGGLAQPLYLPPSLTRLEKLEGSVFSQPLPTLMPEKLTSLQLPSIQGLNWMSMH